MRLNHKGLEKDEWLSLMSSTPTLAGLCITIVAVIRRFSDNIFAFCAFEIFTVYVFYVCRVTKAKSEKF